MPRGSKLQNSTLDVVTGNVIQEKIGSICLSSHQNRFKHPKLCAHLQKTVKSLT